MTVKELIEELQSIKEFDEDYENFTVHKHYINERYGGYDLEDIKNMDINVPAKLVILD